jgi:tagatose 1,6-diphosphate aldolase
LYAFQAGASGFLAGRAIWQASFSAYPDWQKIIDGLSSDGFSYLQKISELADKKAMRWTSHKCYGDRGAALSPQDFSFTENYDSI